MNRRQQHLDVPSGACTLECLVILALVQTTAYTGRIQSKWMPGQTVGVQRKHLELDDRYVGVLYSLQLCHSRQLLQQRIVEYTMGMNSAWEHSYIPLALTASNEALDQRSHSPC